MSYLPDANRFHGNLGTLADGATITPDGIANGLGWSVTLGGDRTLANPTNVQPGDSFFLEIIQGTGGSRLISSYGSNWKFVGGTAPVLSTAEGAKDVIGGIVNAAGHCVVTGVALDVQ